MTPPASAAARPHDQLPAPAGVRIRQARPAEYEAVGEVTIAGYAGLVAADREYVNDLRRAAHRAENSELLVAVDEKTGVILGTVAFAVPGSAYAEVSQEGEGEFRMLAVRPDARGRGIGEALVEACLDRARRHGFTAVAISTVWDMRAAHRLYARMGFHRAPERDWWPVPEVELICYLKDLREVPPA
ncbi:GNAT family N-acetyltransferase [Embleya sp. NBC_00896]|uniref:GNAT family N-acetyltransferase n=1 Tax=Embleya sp. NBC_00896 TaxID=2975961 RepID=UPI00386BA7BF|nr:GNAT family N-acetyltransferase [Embleya sp. NBC_00896]